MRVKEFINKLPAEYRQALTNTYKTVADRMTREEFILLWLQQSLDPAVPGYKRVKKKHRVVLQPVDDELDFIFEKEADLT
jgi:hypothetical protein